MTKTNATIKVILASRPKMLSDVIRNMIEHQPDMELIGEVLDPIELLNTTRAMSVDVVIISPLAVNGRPRICSHLLNEHPLIKIIILAPDGQGFLYQSDAPTLHIDDPSEQAILTALRTSIRKTIRNSP